MNATTSATIAIKTETKTKPLDCLGCSLPEPCPCPHKSPAERKRLVSVAGAIVSGELDTGAPSLRVRASTLSERHLDSLWLEYSETERKIGMLWAFPTPETARNIQQAERDGVVILRRIVDSVPLSRVLHLLKL